MCQTLGYHRASTLGDGSDANDTRPLVFWFAYMLDKGLALRLGRASSIQDYDVTLPRTPRVKGSEQWAEILRLWIQHATVQGHIYEQLYSPRALTRPEGERVACAHALAGELRTMAGETRRNREQLAAHPESPEMLGMVLRSDEVAISASLTLVYRAIPTERGHPSNFSPECIEAAKGTMQMHQECMTALQASDTLRAAYVHW